MSVKVSAWVWEHSHVANRGDLLVLLALADHARDDGSSAYPSVDTLARKARLSRRGTFDALRRLKAAGAISPEGTGPHGTVPYRIHLGPVQPVHGANAARVQSAARGVQSDALKGCSYLHPNHP
jgi:helix-turn-helix protein